jgi:3',5'-cyclic-AMP phosphodiesterase
MRKRYALVAVLLLGGCLRPSEERAERDLEVGHATIGGVSFAVEGGLAAVRRSAPGELELWASAPCFAIDVTSAAAATASYTLTIDNLLTDTELVVGGSAVDPLPGGSAKRRAWTMAVVPGSSTRWEVGPPDCDATEPWSFAVLSDVQNAVDHIRDAWLKINQEPTVRFVVSAGDLTQHGGEAEFVRFQAELAALERPLYTTLGNHELGSDSDRPRFHDWYGRGSFSFDYRHTTFTFLDSANATLDPRVHGWLDGWLAHARAGAHVVVTHFPLVDPIGVRNGSFSSRNEAYEILSRLSGAQVDLLLHGHIHSYYAYEMAGIPVRISGGGGALPERFDNIGRHFLVVDVDPAQGKLNGTRLVPVP